MDFLSIARFAQAHRDDDPVRLLLNRHRYPEVEMALVAQQLEGLATAPDKWPTLAACPDVVYPPRLNREQSSSEATARYKASLVDPALGPAADLTGGMGIDTLFIAQRVPLMHYCEQDPDLCQLAAHNFAVLRQENISIHEGDSIQWLRQQPDGALGTLIVDPARRDSHGGRVAAFEDCTPDILPLLPLFRSRARRVIIKASPMLDIHTALRQLGAVSEVHIVAVGGECKELLFLLGDAPTEIVCTDMVRDNHQNSFPTGFAHSSPPHSGLDPESQRSQIKCPSIFNFQLSEEQSASCPLAERVMRYLYESNASLMKGGCYRLLGQRFGLSLLDRNTHLYTSDRLVADFPGRIFEVEQEIHPSPKAVKAFFPNGKAHVVCRNYPLRADLLQQQLHLKEGGDRFLIATTHAGHRTAFACRPADKQSSPNPTETS